MKALVYRGPRNVRLETVPDPTIEQPTDVIVRITTTNICGSDLHMYEGRTDVEKGTVLGHENLGEVVEVGPAVKQLKVGDLVCLPFNISCGTCANCQRGLTGFCLTANPGNAGAAYGYSGMGPYAGGQAEYLRVPWAEFNALKLPEDARERQADYVMLSDIFPTGWHATELAGLEPGESVVIYGCGPVGLMAAHSAMIRGARQVIVIDRHPDRLKLAKEIGAIPIDDSKGDHVEQVLELTHGGADRGCECVGYQCHDPAGHEVPNMTMNDLVKSVRATAGIGVVGVFPSEDPGSKDELAKKGQIAFDFGSFFEKGLHMGSGQANVKAYNRPLCALIEAGRARPSWIVSHELPLEEAAEGYKNFDARGNGWTKVLLHPGAKTGGKRAKSARAAADEKDTEPPRARSRAREEAVV
ncbi:MAG TPA: glutathione-independent formaldehyde dehydrogenase [Candidatus Didemnitutus sp.]|nr:glutathione-independent formaldehyde dehydrogenase [Candidatus Didemnitutus sp.]